MWSKGRHRPAALHLPIGHEALWHGLLRVWSTLRQRRLSRSKIDAGEHEHIDKFSDEHVNEYSDEHSDQYGHQFADNHDHGDDYVDQFADDHNYDDVDKYIDSYTYQHSDKHSGRLLSRLRRSRRVLQWNVYRSVDIRV